MAANVMEIYGSKVFNEHVMKERLPSATYKSLEEDPAQGCPSGHRGGKRRGQRDEALGHGAGCHPLHPLVPAADRHHQ